MTVEPLSLYLLAFSSCVNSWSQKMAAALPLPQGGRVWLKALATRETALESFYLKRLYFILEAPPGYSCFTSYWPWRGLKGIRGTSTETDLGERAAGGDEDRSPTASLTECAQHDHSGMIYLFIFSNTLDKSFMIQKGSEPSSWSCMCPPFYVWLFVSWQF